MCGWGNPRTAANSFTNLRMPGVRWEHALEGRGMHLAHRTPMSRRAFIGGTAAAAALVGTAGVAAPAHAHEPLTGPAKPAPSPIGAIIPSGVTEPAFLEFIHWLLPGPIGSSTPFIGIPGFGLDVEPSTMGDYRGFTTFAVVSGQAEGSDGNSYDLEFDIRVMRGEYQAADGSRHHGTFAFL